MGDIPWMFKGTGTGISALNVLLPEQGSGLLVPSDHASLPFQPLTTQTYNPFTFNLTGTSKAMPHGSSLDVSPLTFAK